MRSPWVRHGLGSATCGSLWSTACGWWTLEKGRENGHGKTVGGAGRHSDQPPPLPPHPLLLSDGYVRGGADRVLVNPQPREESER